MMVDSNFPLHISNSAPPLVDRCYASDDGNHRVVLKVGWSVEKSCLVFVGVGECTVCGALLKPEESIEGMPVPLGANHG